MLSLALAGVLAAGAAGAAVADDPRRTLLEQKLRLVQRLLASADEEFPEQRTARVMLESARAYLADERLSLVEEALDHALRLAGEMARRSRAERPHQARAARRYEELRDGVHAFRQAHAEAGGERAAGTGQLDHAQVEALLSEAESRAATGDYAAALASVGAAYEMTASALAALRAHQTVEHRLVFASPQEEYRYEVERYRSSEMLVRLVLAERQPDARALEHIDDEMARARRLGGEAEALAESGRVEEAIRAQESATAHLVRALRHAGLYVPQ